MLKQPSTNVKMTNVAIIRYKINNKNFQIACYRNKVLNYRNGVQNDVTEVLQIDQIFQNASHGLVAKKGDLNKYFQNKTKLQIIQIILQRGQLQVTDKQRDAQQSTILAQIINIIVQKCVHSTSKRRFTHDIIKQAIKQIHFAVKTDQSSKRQALQCIKLLQQKYKITRGDMRIKITCQEQNLKQIQKQLKILNIDNLQSEQIKNQTIIRIYDIKPNKYRDLNMKFKNITNITIEIMINVVVNELSKDLDQDQTCLLEPLISNTKEEDKVKKNQVNGESDNKNIHKKQQKILKCSICQNFAIFSLPAEQRLHFKSQWHSENVKRKAKNLPIISKEEYQFNKNYQ